MARRLVYHVQSKRLTPQEMIGFMLVMWIARAALWLTIGLVTLIGFGVWKLYTKLRGY